MEKLTSKKEIKENPNLFYLIKTFNTGYIGSLILISYYIFMTFIGGNGVIFGSVTALLGLLGGIEYHNIKRVLR